MSKYRRPWWLVVNKPAGLITTVRQESGPEKRHFIIRGEPLVQGLAWLTWGPVGALLVIAVLTGIAITFNVKDQSGLVRILFIGAFLLLPALAWGITTLAATRLSKKYLAAERQAETRECLISLNQNRGEFTYKTDASAKEVTLPYGNIHRVRVTPAIGARAGRSMCLTLETEQGPIILLDEALGTQAQKIDLAREIQNSLKNYTDK